MSEGKNKIVLPISGQSRLAPELIKAFLETDFRTDLLLDDSIVLNVGKISNQLIKLHKNSNVTSSAFITAWNPHSQITSADSNARLNKALREHLFCGGFEIRPGIGQYPSGSWEGEESFLVLGMSLEDAMACGNKFEQNAIVWIGKEGVPQLVVLQ